MIAFQPETQPRTGMRKLVVHDLAETSSSRSICTDLAVDRPMRLPIVDSN